MALTYTVSKIITSENNNSCHIVISVSNGEIAKITITKEELQNFVTLSEVKTYIKTKVTNLLKQKEMFGQLIPALQTFVGKEIL